MSRFWRFSRGIGIDLGTANTILYVQGKGVVLNQPSVVAVQNSTGKVVAVGSEARSMLGRVPLNITVYRPLRDGVIADFERAEAMIQYFVKKVKQEVKSLFFSSPNIVVCVPHGATPVERRAIHDAALTSGARSVFLIEESMAAAMGANLPVMEPTGSMVVDIGGGTTEVAVISLGGIVCSVSVRCGGDRMDETIVNYFRKAHNLLVGENSAERLKCSLFDEGVAPQELKITGREMTSGRPKEIIASREEVLESLAEPMALIVETVQKSLEQTPPELAGDISERGIVLTGGGALLAQLRSQIEEHTGVKTMIADAPLLCVAMGTGKCLDRLQEFTQMVS
ncbi:MULTISPECIES: rod shape-determining protein [Holospora]|uniref:Cell shape-determining protein MreB n=2 Tax=Holospora TaxID=44747 RepID=A0A061JHZ9_9PROT|nr:MULTISPECIES: rod shape-determining protein [Holospora]ETZ04589.1 rod shape-determining protein MreB [Holospora undulata HU1]GAJ45956.1 rod shape-determining protein MreB [Holospora elegans E1]